MSVKEDIKKQQRFDAIEKIILSPEFEELSFEVLKQYRRELPANIPFLARDVYNPKCQHLLSLISSRLDSPNAIPQATPNSSSDSTNHIYDWYKKPLGIIILGVITALLVAIIIWCFKVYGDIDLS